MKVVVSELYAAVECTNVPSNNLKNHSDEIKSNDHSNRRMKYTNRAMNIFSEIRRYQLHTCVLILLILTQFTVPIQAEKAGGRFCGTRLVRALRTICRCGIYSPTPQAIHKRSWQPNEPDLEDIDNELPVDVENQMLPESMLSWANDHPERAAPQSSDPSFRTWLRDQQKQLNAVHRMKRSGNPVDMCCNQRCTYKQLEMFCANCTLLNI